MSTEHSREAETATASQKTPRKPPNGAERQRADSPHPNGHGGRLAAASTPTESTTQRKRAGRGPSKRLDRDLTTVPTSELPAHLRMGETAAVCRVSLRTVRQWAADGLIRVVRPAGHGGIVLIPRTEVLRLLGEA